MAGAVRDPVQLQALDIRRLRHLRAAVSTGSLSGAAETLGLTQPALSSSIKSLEADLGVTLLERHRYGVVGTAYAETLLEHFHRVEAELQAAWTRVGRLRQDSARELHIGCGPSEAMRLLPRALDHLRRQHPQLRVCVEYGLNERLMPMVRHGEIECALSSIPSSIAHPDLHHRTLYVDRAAVIARADHPLAAQRKVSPADLARHPWVLARRWELERRALDELFAHGGLPALQACVETDSAILMKTLVMHGDYLSFVPLEMIHWEQKAGLLRPLEGIGSSWERHVGITTRKDAAASDALAALTDSLVVAAPSVRGRS